MDELTEEELRTVSKHLFLEWKDVGRNLELPEADIECLDRVHRNGTATEVCFQMLLMWHRKNGKNATRQCLSNALLRADRTDLSERYCNPESPNDKMEHYQEIFSLESPDDKMERYQARVLENAFAKMHTQLEPMVIIKEFITSGLLTNTDRYRLSLLPSREERVCSLLSLLKSINGRAFPVLVDALKEQGFYASIVDLLTNHCTRLRNEFKIELTELLLHSSKESLTDIKLLLRIEKSITSHEIEKLKKRLYLEDKDRSNLYSNGSEENESKFVKRILQEEKFNCLVEVIEECPNMTTLSAAIREYHRVSQLPAIYIHVAESNGRGTNHSKLRSDFSVETLIEMYLFFRETYGVHFVGLDRKKIKLMMTSPFSVRHLRDAFEQNLLQEGLVNTLSAHTKNGTKVCDIQLDIDEHNLQMVEQRFNESVADKQQGDTQTKVSPEFEGLMQELESSVKLEDLDKLSRCLSLPIDAGMVGEKDEQKHQFVKLLIQEKIITEQSVSPLLEAVETCGLNKMKDALERYENKVITPETKMKLHSLENREEEGWLARATKEFFSQLRSFFQSDDGIYTSDVERGSIVFKLRIMTIKALDKLLEEVRSGSLKKRLMSFCSSLLGREFGKLEQHQLQLTYDEKEHAFARRRLVQKGEASFEGAMKGPELEALHRSRVVIEDELEPMILVKNLMKHGVMDYEDMEQFQTENLREKRVDLFVSFLEKRGNAAFWFFLDALKLSGCYQHVVIELEQQFKNTDFYVMDRTPRGNQASIIHQSTNDSLEEEGVLRGSMNVSVSMMGDQDEPSAAVSSGIQLMESECSSLLVGNLGNISSKQLNAVSPGNPFMTGDPSVRIRRIEGNLLKLENLNPFCMPTKDVLRKFIHDVLRDMVAEAIDLRKANNFREAANILNRSLLVYVNHVYPQNLQSKEDEVMVMEIRIFKATMSVFAGLFQWAIEEALYVAHEMAIDTAYADRRRDAQSILCVAKAGVELLKYRDGKLSKIELTRQQKMIHHLKGTGQEAIVDLMIKELVKELGPFVEASEATANQGLTPDPEWIPEYVKKHREKVETNKARKREILQQVPNEPAPTGQGGYNGSDSFEESPPPQHVEQPKTRDAIGQQSHQTPIFQGQRSSANTHQRPAGNRFDVLDSQDKHVDVQWHQGPSRRGTSPQRPMSPSREAPSPTQGTGPVRRLRPQPALGALSPSSQGWLRNYQFKLACQKCFAKNPHCEGIEAFKFFPRPAHTCSGEILICQLKSLRNQFWGRIRQRTNLQFTGAFSICLNFFKGIMCQPGNPTGYNLCYFAHSQEEMIIWEADRARNFNGKELVTFLRQQEIYRKAQQQQQHTPISQQQVLVPLEETLTTSLQPRAPILEQHAPSDPRDDGGTMAKATPGDRKAPSQPAPAVKGSLLPQKPLNSGKSGPLTAESDGPEERERSGSESRSLAGGLTPDRAQKVILLMQSLKGNFIYCCSECFNASPPRISVQHHKKTSKCTNNEQRHDWTTMNRLLVFFDHIGGFFKIRPRPAKRPAKITLCLYCMKRCGCLRGDSCVFGHNEVEVEFWLFESRFPFISREEVVEVSEKVHSTSESPPLPAASPKRRTPSPNPSAPKPIPPFQHRLRILCGICYPRVMAERSERNPQKCESSSQHPWGMKVVYEIHTSLKKWDRVFPRPPKLRLEIHPSICWRQQNCDYRGKANRQCLFPHYQEEKDLWIYQAHHKLQKIEDVVEMQRGGNVPFSRQNNPQARGGARLPTADTGTTSQYICTYCKQVFDDKWHLEQHLKSPEHIAKMNSDREKNWQHRDPPAHITNGVHKMCRFNATGMCRFSGKAADENLCDYAHSEEEQTEWTERHKYRMMKMEKAREQRLFSFLDELIQAYNFTNKKEEVMMEDLPGVEVTCAEQLEVIIPYEERSEEGSYHKQWEFYVNVSEQKKLKRIGLLYDEHRHYFYLSHPSGEERPQICPGSRLVIDTADRNRYSFQVLFSSGVLGCFHQWVVFDFGAKPILYVPLIINIGSEQIKPHVTMPSVGVKKPWNEHNSVIIEYPAEEPEDPFYRFLRDEYPPPVAANIRLDENHQRTRLNVKEHFHKMLFLEEAACNERLKKFSGWTRLELLDAITEDMYQVAPDGQLFGKISLTDSLLDDSEASQIVVSNVRFALLKFDETSDIVYQAKIPSGKDMDSLRTQDSIYISLGHRCVQEQGLDANKKNLKILVQFQLERIPFCEMHFGVDNVTEMSLLYPPANMDQRFPKITRDECEASGMNPRQAAVSKYVVLAHKRLPLVPGPTMIIGPFGSGKTQTMAKTMIKLLEQSPYNKILVCTHSNSAADWLVTHYLHPRLLEMKQNDATSERKLLRVYATVKNHASVDEIILNNYAIFKEGTNRTSFRKPTFRDIIDCHIVVVTLATSIHLVAMNVEGKTVKGFFKHIFIDEAAQALEPEVIIPLGLAVKETLVVLAGDHIQMRPKVYSEVARKHKFNMSMLERLFYRDKRCRCNNVCFLTFNYRMIDEILRFIARFLYQCKLVTMSNHFRHPNYHPMSFLTVKGSDQLIGTSYVNTAEVNAIVEKIQELVQCWPREEWGNEYNIAVLTPYRLQVNQIRQGLRRKGLGGINVESVQNVQGKEFKAVFISTVRTRKTLNKAQITAISSSGQGSFNEQFYYGFLSDEGELITAFTRCQCLLYVIGDPIALCSVGDCHGIWERYIKECENNGSLYPLGITLELIKQEIQAAKQMLNPSANTFQPRTIPSLMSPPVPSDVDGASKEPSFSKASAPVSAWVKGPPRNITGGTTSIDKRPSSSSVPLERLSSIDYPILHQADREAPEDEFGDYQEELDIDDEILKELRIQVKKDERVYKEVKERQVSGFHSKNATFWDAVEEASDDGEHDKQESDDEGNDSDIYADDEDDCGHSSGLTLPSEEKASLNDDESITDKDDNAREAKTQQKMPRMVVRDGGIFLIRHNHDSSGLRSANDFDAYDSDEEKDYLETELNEDQTDDWLRKSLEEPDDYKICIVRFDPSGRVYAIPADGSSTEEIVISSKRRRERALDGDKVVMHILSETDGDYEVKRDDDALKKMYGEVKHILKRSIHPKFKKVVCTIDPINHDLMCPVDRSFPKMFPLGRERDAKSHDQNRGLPEFQLYNIAHYGSAKFERSRKVKVKYADIPNKLFVVQYFEWAPRNAYPLGIITEELPPCNSPDNALRILKLMHGVKDQWPPQFAKAINDQFPSDWVIPEEELVVREEGDFRNKAVFTVDPPDAQDLDDALHVERLSDGMMKVGVHIADVSYFIAKESPLDGEARKRGTTFYPAFYASASHMLPSQFSTSLCSLLPNEEKLTLSVILTFDRDGKEIGGVQILRSIICPVERLTYETVELFLLNQNDGCNISEQVKREILDLHNLTSYLRMQRLGDGRLFHQPEESDSDVTCTMAHTLVEEMMICANEAVAKFLVERYGMNVPVRHQFPPDPKKTQDWLTSFEKGSSTSLRLSSIMPKLKQVIEDNRVVQADEGVRKEDDGHQNSLASATVSDVSTGNVDEGEDGIPLTNTTWDKIMGILDNINHTHSNFVTIIGNEGGHPKQAVALSQLYKIMDRGLYSCAQDLVSGCQHFDLQRDFYTHFTSPIRRYIDLVVHRMVTAAIGGEDAPYTPRELADICHHCNNQSFKAKKYSEMSRCLLSALKLKLAAEPKLSFIEAADDRGLQIMFPHERYLRATRSSTSIPLRFLKPAKKPEDGDIPSSVRLYFKNSVYDLLMKVPELPKLAAFLKTNRFVQTLPLSSWNDILTCLREEDSEGLEDLLYELRRKIQDGSLTVDTQSSRIKEVTCEMQSLDPENEVMEPIKYAHFQCDFNPGQVMQVQLASSIQKGLLVPRLQLVSMTPRFSFCVEHRESPVECFARLADKPPEKCKTITQYVSSWLPVVEMMIAYNTVSGDETVFIRDVLIQWYKTQEEDGSINICGCFSLDKNWCNSRHFVFYSTKKLGNPNKTENPEMDSDDVLSMDYLCIRLEGCHVAPNVQYKMKSLEQKPGLVTSNTTNPHCGTMTLVVHGLTTSVSNEERGGQSSVNVEFKVHQNACDIPQEFFDHEKGPTRCTVELIPKSVPDRRAEDALIRLPCPTLVRNLIRKICLQRSVKVMNNVEDSDATSKYLFKTGVEFDLSQTLRVKFRPPNESQATAIRTALSNSFAVIQGPPGTGKTRTGAFLAYYFHLLNQGLQTDQRPQILYCGPSNKSVDVIAEYLKEFMSDDFSIVRVYSETIERREFPIPGIKDIERKFGSGQQEARMDPTLKNVSLHHRIRAPTAPYAHEILTYDRQFARGNFKISKKTKRDIFAYMTILGAAVKSEFAKHQIVLCTCNTAGRADLKKATNIVQLIIDEAGMCSEPESLIPMANHNPSQVVLIGDHMQLRPIIQEPHAVELGAGKSLMEKYKKRAHTLNIQYRMHEEICRFPSDAFYEGRLQTALPVQQRKADELTGHIWPNGPNYPRVFCHVVGVEETLTVRSEEGNEMSRSNPQEVRHVVRMVDYFINNLGVNSHQLVVLSQYRLQCTQITEELEIAGLSAVTVVTVIKSQGSEWDYVIFSTVRSMAKIEVEDRPGKGWKMRHLGFTMDENQMNVAMSRARRGHIVVGNKFLLGVLPKWKDLLQVYEDTKSLLPAREFPSNVYPRRR